MDTRYGSQPAKLALRKERWSYRAAAEQIGVTKAVLVNTVFGLNRPNDVVRDGLPRLLGVPLEELFTEDALSK